MDESCLRCGHAEADHDDQLVYCLVPGCTCLAYVSEADELESALASGEEPTELDFDEDGSR